MFVLILYTPVLTHHSKAGECVAPADVVVVRVEQPASIPAGSTEQADPDKYQYCNQTLYITFLFSSIQFICNNSFRSVILCRKIIFLNTYEDDFFI